MLEAIKKNQRFWQTLYKPVCSVFHCLVRFYNNTALNFQEVVHFGCDENQSKYWIP